MAEAADLYDIIPTSDFLARFTNAEYRALWAQFMLNTGGFNKNWDIMTSDDTVRPSRQKAQTVKADLVATGVLTQVRADEIFS
jgi:hypothetical protein